MRRLCLSKKIIDLKAAYQKDHHHHDNKKDKKWERISLMFS
jgi:hypothetical protein